VLRALPPDSRGALLRRRAGDPGSDALTLAPSGQATFNVGSGVVFDSEAGSEYDECLLKAAFLAQSTSSLQEHRMSGEIKSGEMP